MIADPRIRMHIRFPGDPPADLSGFGNPMTIPGWVVRRIHDDTMLPTKIAAPSESKANQRHQMVEESQYRQRNPTPPPAQTLRGFATWYDLPGNRTGYGDIFDRDRYTAAMTRNRAPARSRVLVQLADDPTRTVIVTVNDTGPFQRGIDGKVLRPYRPDPNTIIDLTPRAFEELVGSLDRGRVRVIVTVLPD